MVCYTNNMIPFIPSLLQSLHTAGGSICVEGVYITLAGEHQCVCPVGQRCIGVCSSPDITVVESGRQICQGLCTKAYVFSVVRALAA